MTLRNAFEDLAIESTQVEQKVLEEGLLYYLAAILSKMPRVDTNARMVVNQETGSTVISSGTVTTVTTVGTVSNQTNIGGRDASNTAFALANIGTAHIYNNIQVT